VVLYVEWVSRGCGVLPCAEILACYSCIFIWIRGFLRFAVIQPIDALSGVAQSAVIRLFGISNPRSRSTTQPEYCRRSQASSTWVASGRTTAAGPAGLGAARAAELVFKWLQQSWLDLIDSLAWIGLYLPYVAVVYIGMRLSCIAHCGMASLFIHWHGLDFYTGQIHQTTTMWRYLSRSVRPLFVKTSHPSAPCKCNCNANIISTVFYIWIYFNNNLHNTNWKWNTPSDNSYILLVAALYIEQYLYLLLNIIIFIISYWLFLHSFIHSFGRSVNGAVVHVWVLLSHVASGSVLSSLSLSGYCICMGIYLTEAVSTVSHWTPGVRVHM